MDFEAQNAFSEDQLEIKISGSSDVKFPHNVKLRLGEFSVSGSGEADEARYSVSGSGDIKAYDLSVNDLSCSVSGSGDARVYAKDNMNLSVSGSGDIRYKGPANVNKSKSGSGSIQGAN